MIDRIQELAAKAKTQVPSGLGVEDWIEHYNAILGRLIIQECVTVLHEQERIPTGFFYSKSANIHELAILQHFGVD